MASRMAITIRVNISCGSVKPPDEGAVNIIFPFDFIVNITLGIMRVKNECVKKVCLC